MRMLNQDKPELPLQVTYALEEETPRKKSNSISGLVTGIVDGNTFVMSIHSEANGSKSEKYTERIRIHGMDTPPISTLSGILAKLDLEKKIVGRKMECEILGRDDSDRIIAILPKQYLHS